MTLIVSGDQKQMTEGYDTWGRLLALGTAPQGSWPLLAYMVPFCKLGNGSLLQTCCHGFFESSGTRFQIVLLLSFSVRTLVRHGSHPVNLHKHVQGPIKRPQIMSCRYKSILVQSSLYLPNYVVPCNHPRHLVMLTSQLISESSFLVLRK